MTDKLPPNPPLSPGKADPTFTFFGWVCCGVPVFGGLVIVILLAISAAFGGGTSSSDNSVEAQIACENRIKDALKSPSSADFNDDVSGSGPYTVTGTVDSENSFGAMLRSNFQCTVTVTDDKTLTSVDYLE
ncbi:hypothetical protein [Curtobacterium sp. NPDC086286]|uniref:hypothetical protein n=1 Tax=Curtobacterium sp. NPDC086286 TaxID=3363964 RepID=UPI0037F522C9